MRSSLAAQGHTEYPQRTHTCATSRARRGRKAARPSQSWARHPRSPRSRHSWTGAQHSTERPCSGLGLGGDPWSGSWGCSGKCAKKLGEERPQSHPEGSREVGVGRGQDRGHLTSLSPEPWEGGSSHRRRQEGDRSPWGLTPPSTPRKRAGVPAGQGQPRGGLCPEAGQVLSP